MPTDLVSLLVFLSGPGLAVISAFILERLQPFDELSSNGKLVVAFSVAGVLGLLAVAAQQLIVPDPALVAKINPYVAVIVPLVSLIAQQLAHGVQSGRERDRFEALRAKGLAEWGDDDEDADDSE